MDEATDYVNTYFPDNFGSLNSNQLYPTTHEEAENWFNEFLSERFDEFGPYEDAVVKEHSILNHSLLSPSYKLRIVRPKIRCIKKYIVLSRKKYPY